MGIIEGYSNLDVWLTGMGCAVIVGGFVFWAIYRVKG